jgi:protein AaeX
MLSEVDVAGVFFAPIVVYAAAAIPLFLVCRQILGRLRILRNTWHPGLFELALYVALVSLLILSV